MRVIFMGTPDFAVGTLQAIARAGYEIVLVVSQPDKPKGRGNVMQAPPVKEAAMALGIEVYQPRRVRMPECVEHLREYRPDMIVVAAFGQILPPEILAMPRYGCINVHASLLPKYRGAAPIQWAVINGEQVSGVTIQRMAEGIDTGDMIAKVEVPLAADETGGSLFERLAEVGAGLCVDTMAQIEAGNAVYTPQREEDATHVGMIHKQLGKINWKQPAQNIERLVRGLNPWPSAYTALNGRILKIWSAAVLPGGNTDEAGCVVESDGRTLIVQTGEGRLSLREVQLEGKKRMGIDAFLRGCEVPTGTYLG
ncbi:MAG: methionyl-tRNA formyltransferase [Lachnospiraceae bacterium]|nr:methionyl-tRNA formyltransferase [Lachnospiraceae bacterium]MDE7436606.1 methionyl-tRNA formyltransferase [Lachnospiraceae bacterium]